MEYRFNAKIAFLMQVLAVCRERLLVIGFMRIGIDTNIFNNETRKIVVQASRLLKQRGPPSVLFSLCFIAPFFTT